MTEDYGGASDEKKDYRREIVNIVYSVTSCILGIRSYSLRSFFFTVY